MLDINIIAIGKVKDKSWQAAVQEYGKRLAPYCRLKLVELPAVPFSRRNQMIAKEQEADRIEAALDKQSGRSVYLLAERGQEFSSPAFAAFLEKSQPLTFVIGGALGFSEELYRRYPQVSLGRLTFPHELARVVLYEQLYRAATIIKKKDYHY